MPSRSAAVNLYRKRKEEVRVGAKLPENLKTKRRVSFAEIGKTAIEWYVSREMSDVRAFSSRMNIAINALDHRYAEDITAGDLDNWIGSRAKTAATFNRYRTTISKAYTLAMVSSLVAANPARLVEPREEQNTRVRYLSADEEARLLKAIMVRCPAHYPAIIVAMHTGMRKSEQFGLTWDRVHFDSRTIHLDKTKSKKPRDIDMSSKCFETLRALYETRTNEYVFQSVRYRGQPIKDPKRWFEAAVIEAGIENLTWHDLRHDFCSKLAQRGVGLQTIAALAGHGSTQVTERYAHLTPGHTTAAIRLLDA